MLTMAASAPCAHHGGGCGHFDHLIQVVEVTTPNSSGGTLQQGISMSWRFAVFDAVALVEQEQRKFGRMLLPHTDWMLRTVSCKPL